MGHFHRSKRQNSVPPENVQPECPTGHRPLWSYEASLEIVLVYLVVSNKLAQSVCSVNFFVGGVVGGGDNLWLFDRFAVSTPAGRPPPPRCPNHHQPRG